MQTKPTNLLLLLSVSVLLSCNNQDGNKTTSDKTETVSDSTQNTIAVKEEAVSYDAGGIALKGYVAYDEKKTGRRPIVLVVPEWWS